MGDEITKREFLKAAGFFGAGVAVGEYLDDDRDQRFIGGGGGGPAGDQLVIGAGVSISVEELQWYSGILWKENGSLVLEEGDSIGLLETEV